MKQERATVSVKLTKNLGNYQSASVDMSIEVQLEEGETLEAVAQDLTDEILTELDTALLKASKSLR